MKNNNLISLKEAARISGYTPDYIGQLIRSGKLSGKQVYSNIAWMTTAEAVMNYKNGDGDKSRESSRSIIKLREKLRKFGLEIEAIKIFFQTFKMALPIIIALIFAVILLSIYFSMLFSGKNLPNENIFNAANQNLSY